jgi:signal transduction histidine kinase
MAAVRDVPAALGGRLEVESPPDAGTRIVVTLPIVAG